MGKIPNLELWKMWHKYYVIFLCLGLFTCYQIKNLKENGDFCYKSGDLVAFQFFMQVNS
jgi:hypothetical protein